MFKLFRRKPFPIPPRPVRKYYQWLPTEDITLQEMAIALPVLIHYTKGFSILEGDERLQLQIESLPQESRRHFTDLDERR